MLEAQQSQKILLIDDRQENLDILKLILRREGYQTTDINHGREIVSFVKEDTPDLILLDILMPGVDGYEVCRLLKADDETADIPIIFLSALIDSDSRVRALETGGVDYITKPFSVQEVLARVRMHLRLRQQQLEIEHLRELDLVHIQQLSYEIQQRQQKETELLIASSQLRTINQIISIDYALNRPDEVLQECCQILFDSLNLVYVVAITPARIADCEDIEWLSQTTLTADGCSIEVDGTLNVQDTLVDLCQNMTPVVSNEDIFEAGAESVLWVPVVSRSLPLIVLIMGHTERQKVDTQENFGWRIGQAVYQVYDNSHLHEQNQSYTNELNEMVAQRTEQLEQTSSRMAAILASISDGIVLLDEEERIENTNTAFDRIFGTYADEYFGRRITDLVEPGSSGAVSECFDRVKSGEKQSTTQAIIRNKNGDLIDVDVSISTIRKSSGRYVINIHDISLLKELERIKNNFFSMITHELRTPITGILLIARQLERYYDRMSEEQRLQKVKELQLQGQSLAELVESVLDTSRLEAREHVILDQSVEVAQIAERIYTQLQANAALKQQTLTFACDEVPAILGDPADVTMICRNLISNAIKYTDNNGSIRFSVGTLLVEQNGLPTWSSCIEAQEIPDTIVEDQTYVVIQVKDNGHGISNDYLPGLFVQFDRGWASNSHIQGTGLGLPMVKETAERYNGHIMVESEVDVGTVFSVLLPAPQAN